MIQDFFNQGIHYEFIIGGFAMFIFGIKYMGDALKSFTGNKLKEYIDKCTSKTWLAVLTGILITVIIQSSSAITAISIGLVRSGLMSLTQAAGIIMGANIGTTVTAFLIGLNFEQYALYFVFIGALIYVFSKRKKTRYIGEIIFGFGILFFGLKLMGNELQILGKMPLFENITRIMAKQPFLALLAGTLMTAVVQSSSVVIGIVQKLYQSSSILLPAALPFVFGSNIGTTITAIFASFGGSVSSKRTAAVHVIFNVGGSILFMLLLEPFTYLITTLASLFTIDPMMQIALAHILFNVIVTLIAYPFISQIVLLSEKIVPGNEETKDLKLETLDTILALQYPAGALNITKQAIQKMSLLSQEGLNESELYLKNKKEIHLKNVLQIEDAINSLDKKITSYLIQISHESLGNKEIDNFTEYLQIVKNIERIGDLNCNLVEFYTITNEEKDNFSKDALDDIFDMYHLLNDMITLSMNVFSDKNELSYLELMDKENFLNLMEDKARQRHFKRITNTTCTLGIAGSVFLDILSNLERMGDHCCNIANIVHTETKE